MSVESINTKKTALQKAEEEIEQEQEKKAIEMLKDKLMERKQAELVLRNIDREIQDLHEQIQDGDIH